MLIKRNFIKQLRDKSWIIQDYLPTLHPLIKTKQEIMKESVTARPPYIKALSINERLNLLKRAMTVHYGNRILLMLEYSAREWCYKLEIPVVKCRLKCCTDTVVFLHLTYLVGHGLKYSKIRVNLR